MRDKRQMRLHQVFTEEQTAGQTRDRVWDEDLLRTSRINSTHFLRESVRAHGGVNVYWRQRTVPLYPALLTLSLNTHKSNFMNIQAKSGLGR